MERVYLDHAATTPLRPEVRDAMAPYLGPVFGNPSSPHAEGRAARSALDEARETVARALGVVPDEIFFVRGGTEADNLALLGRADLARHQGRSPVLVVSTVEHRAVLEPAAAVEAEGGEIIRLPVDRSASVDEETLTSSLNRRPDLVSLLWVNNETGIRLPVEEVAERCRAAGTVFHTDAVQALGKIPVHPGRDGIDLLSASGHKIGGPKGTGFLFVREGVEVQPRIFGGGQEAGLRPGTEDVAGAVGLARAVELACAEVEAESERLAALRDHLEELLRRGIPDLRIHGAETVRAPHVLNVGVPGGDLDALLVSLDLAGISVSSGSACSSGASSASHVLTALYGEEIEGVAPLRFSLGLTTTASDVERASSATVTAVERARGGRVSSTTASEGPP